jgi:thiol-disulfide isomerase/thioredoxin
MKQILFFTQTGCKPCLELKPFVEQVAAKNNVTVDFIDIRTEGGKKSAAAFGVWATPEIFIIEDGKIKAHFTTPGETKEKLQAALSGVVLPKGNTPDRPGNSRLKSFGLVAGTTILGYMIGKRNGAIIGAVGGVVYGFNESSANGIGAIKYSEPEKVETYVKGDKKIFIYRTEKIGTTQVYFFPVTNNNKRLNSTLYQRKWEAVGIGKKYLNS